MVDQAIHYIIVLIFNGFFLLGFYLVFIVKKVVNLYDHLITHLSSPVGGPCCHIE